MAGNKYIANTAGTLTEVASIQTSAGAGDAGKIPAVDSTGRLDSTFMPVGIAPDTASIVSSENLAAGDFVNIHDVAGAFRVRKADATVTGKFAHGFVLAAVTSPAAAQVFFEGQNTQVSGATPGDRFLSTTAGGHTATAPSAAGQVVQRIGVAVSATVINFEPGVPVVLV